MRLIDADALKEHIQVNAKIYAEAQFPLDVIIDNAPTVDTFTFDDMKKGINVGYKAGRLTEKWERPQGEWIIVNQDNEGIHEIKCPFCHYSKGGDFSSILTVTFERFPPFCESCGADMRGKEE